MVSNKAKTVCLAGALALAASAALASPMKFAGHYYGQINLPFKESAGDAANYIEQNKGAFEPIYELGKTDPLRKLSRPIGRIDIKFKMADGSYGMSSCTGALLAGNYVLTNHHCIPVKSRDKPVKASILMNYLTMDGKGAERFELSVKPTEWSQNLDYVVVKVQGDPVSKYGHVNLSLKPADPNDRLVLIHHPLGMPKVMTRFRCFAFKTQNAEGYLRHRCDSQPGSSGSLLFNISANAVGLHHTGGLNKTNQESFNNSTQIATIIGKSILVRKAAEANVKVAAPVKVTKEGDKTVGSPESVKGVNDLLTK